MWCILERSGKETKNKCFRWIFNISSGETERHSRIQPVKPGLFRGCSHSRRRSLWKHLFHLLQSERTNKDNGNYLSFKFKLFIERTHNHTMAGFQSGLIKIEKYDILPALSILFYNVRGIIMCGWLHKVCCTCGFCLRINTWSVPYDAEVLSFQIFSFISRGIFWDLVILLLEWNLHTCKINFYSFIEPQAYVSFTEWNLFFWCIERLDTALNPFLGLHKRFHSCHLKSLEQGTVIFIDII